MGLLVAGISWLWNKVSLEEVTYERTISQPRVFIGEETTMSISVINRKPVPLGRLEIWDELPEDVQVVDADITSSANPNSNVLFHSTSMSWYERITWDYKIKSDARGYYRIGPVKMASGDLFGFFNSESRPIVRDYLLVYPKIVPLPEMGLPAVRPLGETRGGIAIFDDPSRPSGIVIHGNFGRGGRDNCSIMGGLQFGESGASDNGFCVYCVLRYRDAI
jgi:uncharacterized protein (DUF58 family)